MAVAKNYACTHQWTIFANFAYFDYSGAKIESNHVILRNFS